MEEIVEARVQFRAHQEKASINGGKHQELRDPAHKLPFQEIEMAFLEKPEEDHAEQVFKNTHRCKDMEKTILGIVAIEPKVIREAEENRPENSRNKESRKKHPECTVTLSKQPAAKPGGHRIAHEETCERPRRFIQFHAQIRDNGPGERKVQEKAPPRVNHLGEARRGAVPYFV